MNATSVETIDGLNIIEWDIKDVDAHLVSCFNIKLAGSDMDVSYNDFKKNDNLIKFIDAVRYFTKKYGFHLMTFFKLEDIYKISPATVESKQG
jgi:hypothetical protein